MTIIKENVPVPHFKGWYNALVYVGYESNVLTVGVPNKFFAEYFDQNYAGYLLKVAAFVYGSEVKLQYHIEAEKVSSPRVEPILKTNGTVAKNALNPAARRVPLPAIDSQLNERYTFDNFVEGESNKLARSVALSITENPGKNTFNPFFLFGESGVGKTHLVNAVGVRIRQLYPEKRVLFVSAHVFKTQYTDSVIHNTSNDFINFYQTIDVLIIDDIQEITTAKTQQAFFHIFNHLQQNNRQLIITSDRPPVMLQGLEDRMLTRFKWGMTAEMEKPDVTLRRDILKSKIKRDGLAIPDDVVEYISRNVNSSVREIEGIVNSIMAYSVVDNCDIDLELTQRIVSRAVNLEKRRITFDDILEAVCKRYDIRQRDLVAKGRKQTIAQARHLAMYLCHKYTDMSSTHIGRRFCGRDHSTVVYACKQISRRLSVDKVFRQDVEDLEATLK